MRPPDPPNDDNLLKERAAERTTTLPTLESAETKPQGSKQSKPTKREKALVHGAQDQHIHHNLATKPNQTTAQHIHPSQASKDGGEHCRVAPPCQFGVGLGPRDDL